ncbi:MAG: histidinol-phosphatase [Syntrophomonadaceae bacterium]|nr:histidinol-phosphatase [Syntrophomonadaceae bacterium]
MLTDFHVHVIAHGEYQYSQEWLRQYIEKALEKRLDVIGFLDHDEYIEQMDFELVKEMAGKYSNIQIRQGLEIDYIPGRDNEIKRLISGNDFDFIIGSVHFIEKWAFDHPDHCHIFKNKDLMDIYIEYYSLVEKAALSGWFDIIGHLDLIKIWGCRLKPEQNLKLVEQVLQSVKRAGTVVEINSGGLRKPVQEIYPSFDIIQRMYELNIPICLSSDAHQPDQTGYEVEKAGQLAKKAGYKYLTVFFRRTKSYVPF